MRRSITERVDDVLAQFPLADALLAGDRRRVVERILVADAYAESWPAGGADPYEPRCSLCGAQHYGGCG
jgi:hypothetical protein